MLEQALLGSLYEANEVFGLEMFAMASAATTLWGGKLGGRDDSVFGQRRGCGGADEGFLQVSGDFSYDLSLRERVALLSASRWVE